jgi:hypothetical protein
VSCFVCGDKPGALARHRAEWPMTELSGITVHRACARDLASAFEFWPKVADSSALVLRWASNDHEPFDDLLALWAKLGYISAEQRAATNAARAESTAAFLAAYRANPPKRSAEEIEEMRAAFGPGETVVDVITGQEIHLPE